MTKLLEHTAENCEKLATLIANSMDMDSLIFYVIGSISCDLIQNETDFYQTIKKYNFEEVD